MLLDAGLDKDGNIICNAEMLHRGLTWVSRATKPNNMAYGGNQCEVAAAEGQIKNSIAIDDAFAYFMITLFLIIDF